MDKTKLLFENNPVILGLNNEQSIEEAINNQSKIVFVLYGDIINIGSIVEKLKDAGKVVFVNIDLIEGLSSKSKVLNFMKETTKTDGIISSKATMLRHAKDLGFVTVHRFFTVDSLSYSSIKRQLEISMADIVNILPGWPKIIEWMCKDTNKPVIASGFVCDKKSVIESLNAGAIAICSTNESVWKM
ncbi:MAG: glycerol-3-phosphate responsive antiterminator [Peptostreptococcaceae bacterium]